MHVIKVFMGQPQSCLYTYFSYADQFMVRNFTDNENGLVVSEVQQDLYYIVYKK